jgi:hypothetical protein
MIKTHRIEIKYFCFLLLFSSLFTGCSSFGVTEKTITSEQALTSVALTVDSKLTTVNEVTITPSLTPTPAPSLTATPTISPSSTVGNTPSQTPQSVNPPAPTTCQRCNHSGRDPTLTRGCFYKNLADTEQRYLYLDFGLCCCLRKWHDHGCNYPHSTGSRQGFARSYCRYLRWDGRTRYGWEIHRILADTERLRG